MAGTRQDRSDQLPARQRAARGERRTDRRAFLGKAGVAVGAAWTAPILVSAITAPAAAQSKTCIPASGMYALGDIGEPQELMYRVDLTTGVGTAIGPANATGASPTDFTWVNSTGVGMGVADGEGLWTVDFCTGAWTPLSHPDSSGSEITYDSANDTLYYKDNLTLHEASPSTGEYLRWVGFFAGALGGLGYDSLRDRLVTSTVQSDPDITILSEVSRSDATLIPIAVQVGRFIARGLAYHPGEDLIYAVEGRNLYTIDPVTGQWTFITTTSVTFGALAYIP